MKIAQFTKTIFSHSTLKSFILGFFSSFGVYALFLQVIDILWPSQVNFGLKGLIYLFLLSLIPAIIIARPKLKFSRYLPTPDITLAVKVSDIFEEEGNLVIGFNDVFDTEIGAVISGNSLQGKFLVKIYNNDKPQLDRDLDDALAGISNTPDLTKTQGKNLRYPLGTVAVLNKNNTNYFCTAYSRMESNLVATSDINRIWKTLDNLWEEIRLKGQCKKISMPVIGTDLARVGGVSHSTIIKLILMSFAINSRAKIISKELVLVIHPGNVGKVNLKDIEEFLRDI